MPSELAFYAKILRCAAGQYAGCMAQAVEARLARNIPTIGTGRAQWLCKRFSN
jgi:hypothetical protein